MKSRGSDKEKFSTAEKRSGMEIGKFGELGWGGLVVSRALQDSK